MSLNQYATVAGAARIAEVPRTTLRRWIEAGRVKGHKLGDGTTLVLLVDVKTAAAENVQVGRPRKRCPHCGSVDCPGKEGSPNYANEDFDRCQAYNRHLQGE